MVSKVVLTTFFIAVCLRNSSEGHYNVIDCFTDGECVEKVFTEDLKTGIVPILVTKNLDRAQEEKFLAFFDDKPLVTKILKISVRYGTCHEAIDFLYGSFQNVVYPFLNIMVDHYVLKTSVVLYDEKNLTALYAKATSVTKSITDYISNNVHFSASLILKIDAKGKSELISDEARTAALLPVRKVLKLTGFELGDFGVWKDVLNKQSPVKQSYVETETRDPPAASRRRSHLNKRAFPQQNPEASSSKKTKRK